MSLDYVALPPFIEGSPALWRQDISPPLGATLAGNILSLGLFSAVVVSTKLKTVTLLNQRSEHIQQKAYLIRQAYNQLRAEADKLTAQPTATDKEIAALKNKRLTIFESKELKNIPSSPPQGTKPTLGQIIVIIAKLVFHWAVNICTIGIYGLVHTWLLDKKIRQISADQIQTRDQINKDIQHEEDNFKSHFYLIEQRSPLKQAVEQPEVEEKFKAKAKLDETKKKVSDLAKQINPSSGWACRAKERDEAVISNRNTELANENQFYRHSIQRYKDAIAQANLLIISRTADLATLEASKQEAESLKQQIATLEEGHKTGAKANILKMQQKLLKEGKELQPQAQPKKGWFGGLAGLFKKTEFNLKFAGCTTATGILEAGVKAAIEELIETSEKEKVIHFTRHSAIWWDTDYDANKLALYDYMTYLIIKQARLNEGDSYLTLNNKQFRIYSSQPQYRADASRVTMETYFINTDEFSPNVGDQPSGIDPVEAKKALKNLTEQEENYYLNYLLAPLIPDDQPCLKETSDFFKRNDKSAQKVRRAIEHLKEISKALGNRYGSLLCTAMGPLLPSDDPLEHLKKTTTLDITPKYTESWEIQEDFFQGCGQLLPLVKRAKEGYEAIFSRLEKKHLRRPFNTGIPTPNIGTRGEATHCLADQFYYTHFLIGHHGCLFSNLLALFVADREQINDENIKNLKKAMANYLDLHGEHMRPRVLSLDQYKQWLRGTINTHVSVYELGEFEINLVAHLMGVRIALFTSNGGTYVDKDTGLLAPALSYNIFGPHTASVMNLYNSTGYTYYALFPILNETELPAISAIRQITSFWYRDYPNGI